MIVFYQIVLLLAMIISFIGYLGEKEDKELRDRTGALFFTSSVLFMVSVIWL